MRRLVSPWLCLVIAICLRTVPAYGAELVVWHAWRGNEQAAFEEAAARWSAAHGVEITSVAIPFGAYDTKLATAIPRGNGPDVFIAGHDGLGRWIGMGLVDPASGGADGHRPITIDALRRDGELWGLPLAYKSLVLLYNPALIDSPPQTTDELIAAAREHSGNGRYGLVYQAAEPYFHAPWVHAFGGQSLESDGTARLDSPSHVAALAFLRRLAIEESLLPAQVTGQLVTQLYAEGNAAFVISGPWFVADVDRPIVAAPLPVVSETGERARPYLTVEGIFVAAQARSPVLAGEFATFLAGPEGAQIRSEIGRQAVSWADIESDDPLLRVLSQQADLAVPMPADAAIANAFEAQARSLRGVLRGALEPELAAGSAQSYFDILARPPAEPASPWPYVLGLGLGLLGLAGWLGQDFLNPAYRAEIWEHRWDYMWLLPGGLTLSVLVVLPFVTGAAVSLLAHDNGTWTFVGFSHFLDILLARDWPLTSPLSFAYTLFVTLLWTVTNVFLHVALGVALALVLREPWIRLRGVWRALLILPWAIPNYITALIWKGMFHAQYGAINAILGVAMGASGPVEIDWFGSFVTSFSANLVTNTWLGFPFMMVITLGALQSIPRDLEEAAEVDGASWWMRFRHVVWPLLKPALLPAVILGSVWTFNMFNVIYLVSAGEPDGSTEILISEAYRWAFSRGNRYGYAAAYAVIIFGVLLVYSKGANRLVGRRVL